MCPSGGDPIDVLKNMSQKRLKRILKYNSFLIFVKQIYSKVIKNIYNIFTKKNIQRVKHVVSKLVYIGNGGGTFPFPKYSVFSIKYL